MITGPILLTGAGGDIGIALACVLRDAFPNSPLIGADCNAEAVGAAFVDRFETLPRADAPEYLDTLASLVTAVQAQILIPLAEAELARLLAADVLQGSFAGASIIAANHGAVATGLDKLATAHALREAGIKAPEAGIVGSDEPGDFDLIIKPRKGQGSKGLLCLSRSEFGDHIAARSGDLWQRWLKSADKEFTCGVARFKTMPTRVLSFRRMLKGGLTGSGEVVHDPRIEKLCKRIAEALDLDGAINIQLRMEGENPMVFEINPRFSSTVGFRHRLGFRDCVWAIEDALGLLISDYEPPIEGTRIDRVARELVRPPLAALNR